MKRLVSQVGPLVLTFSSLTDFFRRKPLEIIDIIEVNQQLKEASDVFLLTIFQLLSPAMLVQHFQSNHPHYFVLLGQI